MTEKTQCKSVKNKRLICLLSANNNEVFFPVILLLPLGGANNQDGDVEDKVDSKINLYSTY